MKFSPFRTPFRWSLVLLIVAAAMPVVQAEDSKDRPGKPAPTVVTEEARLLHASALVFDGQNGLPGKLRSKGDLSFRSFDLHLEHRELHTDIPRLRKGNVGAQFWSVYVPTAAVGKGTVHREVLDQIDLIHRMVKSYPDTFEIANRASDIGRIRQEGKIASLIGVEGGHSLGGSLGTLRMYHHMGVRFLTLTNTDNCDVADSAGDKRHHKGLSKFGELVVAEMNRLGMVIDLAHCSNETRKQVLLLSRAPVMFSHTAADGLAPHPRNVPDDILRAVAKNNGIVMVNFYPAFLTPEGIKAYDERSKAAHKLRAKITDDREYNLALLQLLKDRPLPPADVRTVVNHIEHIIKVAGIDHVGLGSNFDGMGTVPRQLEDVSCFPQITQELLNRGHTPEAIRKVLGGNMLRVLREVEAAASPVTVTREE